MQIQEFDLLILDFDGVLTDNSVYLNEKGEEMVRCSRADGLAFDYFRKINKKVYIVSTEKNPVVSRRADKLRVAVVQGVGNKASQISSLARDLGIDLKRIAYIGNDINDLAAMQMCGYSFCPSDSHSRIKGIVTSVLRAEGGKAVIREFVEETLGIDLVEEMYGE